MIPRLKPIKPVRRLGIVERAGERKEPPAIPKPAFPRIETDEKVPPALTPMRPQYGTPMEPRYAMPVMPQRPGIYTPAPPLMPREPEIIPPPREVVADGVTPAPQITPPEDVGVAPKTEVPITQSVPIGVSVPLNRHFSTIHSMASTNVALAMSHANRVWDMINKAEGEIRGILEAQGKGIDPATRVALQELKRQSELERNRIIGWYNQRGLLRGNILAQEINRFQQNILTAQERMLADVATRNQERLHSTLMQFALQRANIAQWEGELALRARQADISEAQWEMARQDAMSKWTAEMAWDREKYYTAFAESARRFGIEQEKIDRAFGLDVRRLEEQARQFDLQHGLDVRRAELEKEQFEFYKTNVIDQTKLDWARLGLEEAKVSNSATMAIRELGEQRRQFDLSLERDREQFLGTLDLKLVEQGFTRSQIDMAKREFDLQLAQNAESIRQFNEGMRLKWAQLGVQRDVAQREIGLREPPKPVISPEVSRNLADFHIRQARAIAARPALEDREGALQNQLNSLFVSYAQGVMTDSDFARALSALRDLHPVDINRIREAQVQYDQARKAEIREAAPPREPQPVPRRPQPRQAPHPRAPRPGLHRRLLR